MSGFQKDQVQDIYYLSPMQEGMLFHTLMNREQNFYVEQMSTLVRGSFQTKWLEASVNVIIDRYDVFRTVFVYEKVKRAVQVVLKKRSFSVDEINLDGLPSDEQAQRIKDFKRQDKERGFDLAQDIPMRMTVLQTGEDTYEWVWTYHHILFDGWCLGIVIQELFRIYESLRQNKAHGLPSPKPYKDFIKWLAKQDKEKSLQYWSDCLSGFAGQSTFAEQRKRFAASEGYRPDELSFRLEQEDTRVFAALAQTHGVTLSTAVQAAWSILLSRYQRTNDVLFGTVVSGRPAELSGAENMVGLFINVVPTRVQLSDDMSFETLIAQLQRQAVQSEAHQFVPIYDIQSNAAQHELIDHILVFENYPIQQVSERQLGEDGFGFSLGDVSIFEKTNYDLNLIVSPGDELVMRMGYNANVYRDDFVTRLSDQLRNIIREVVQNPELPLAQVEMVSEGERGILLSEFNPQHADEPSTITLPQWIEQQVVKAPNRTALITEDGTLTYEHLNERANQLGRVLQAKGVTHETVVAMMMHRCPEMIVGILAILKAGGAYLPIDPTYPNERIRYMLQDSGTQLLLTQHALTDLVYAADFQGESLLIDDASLYQGSGQNIDHAGTSDDLAYVMYTSGTTGKPKGNLTTHANISRVLKDTNYLEITADDTVLSLSNYAFDGFTFDLFGALTNGARLVLAQKETILHVGNLVQLIQSERVTVMFVTTALFNLLVDAGDQWMGGIRKVLFGGERSSVNHVRKALSGLGAGKIVHVYGPTETTVFATFYPVDDVPEDAVSIPIGRPLNHTSAYILSPTNQLQPIGGVGELCLGGTGLARGYLNRPDLTATKFVAHPFAARQRMYRTGDLARWLPDGTIEFIGRIDDQIKIRGHRVELGEIEKGLVGHSAVKAAVVHAVQSDTGETSLCAYVVLHPGQALSGDELRSHLATTLPGYMVPAAYALLDSLPLTANGKVDRRLLPQPPSGATASRDMTPPRNDVEVQLVQIWCELLGIDEIGIHDDFFAMGGHSLKAMALCAQILKEFDVDVPIQLVFANPTVAGMAAFLHSDHGLVKGISMEQEDDALTIMNPDGVRNLFVFPPVLGYGIVFRELAKLLPDYRIHAFNFLEHEDRIGRYTRAILNVQSSGAIAILGYSAGCSLAFEVAKALESTGQSVDVLIMVDSYMKNGRSDLQGRTVEADVEALMKVNQDNIAVATESIRKGLARKMSAYYRYYVELINTGQVGANVHLIKSQDVVSLPQELLAWNEATTGVYREHQGRGKHEQMLQGSSVELNAKIIADILASP